MPELTLTEERVRAALAPHDLEWTVDARAALARGRARVRRRRVLVGAGAAVAVTATVVPLAFSGGPGAQLRTKTAPPAAAPSATPTSSPCLLRAGAIKKAFAGHRLSVDRVMEDEGVPCTPATDVPKPSPPAPVVAVGDIVTTGKQNGKGTQALYFFAIHEAQLPDVDFGLMEGNVTASAGRRDCYETNALRDPMAPGFHAVAFDGGIDCGWTNTIGYVVGDAVRVTGVVDGRSVEGHVAAWSHDGRVKAFWLNGRGSRFTAYDAAGRVVASSTAAAAVG